MFIIPKPKLSSPEAVKEHISRLISENEAILDPPPVLMKRRTYHRHASGSLQSSSGESGAGLEDQGLESPGKSSLAKAGRSQSLIVDPGLDLRSQMTQDQHRQQLVNSLLRQQHQAVVGRGGSLPITPSMQPSPGALMQQSGGSPGLGEALYSLQQGKGSPGVTTTGQQATQVQCNFCSLLFLNETSLKAHAFRCNKKPDHGSMHASPTESSCSSSAQISPLITHPSTSHHMMTLNSLSGTPYSLSTSILAGQKSSSVGSGSFSSSRSTGTASPSVENKHPLKKRMLAEAEKMRSEEEEERRIKIARFDESDSMLNEGEKAALSLLQLRNQHSPSMSQTPQHLINEQPPVTIAAPKAVRPPVAKGPMATQVQSPQNPVSLPGGHQIPASIRRQQFHKTRNQPPVQAQASHVPDSGSGVLGRELTEVNNVGGASLVQNNAAPTAYVLVPQPVQSVFPQVSLSSAERDQTFKPYCITVQVPGAQSFEAPQSGRRPRHVTAPTFVCLKRPQPMFLHQKDSKLSMYKNWQQLPVNPAEAKMNLLLMGGCSLKRKLGSGAYWRYTVAEGEMGVLRMTHSSFWNISKKGKGKKEKAGTSGGGAGAGVESKGAKKEISTQTPATSRQQPTTSGPEEEGSTPKLPKKEPPGKGETNENKVISRPSRLTKELLKGALANREHVQRKPKWKLVCNGGYSTDEGYTYVRGRGRGRYVCGTCGIRCRKPSMLKKHIRTHQNVRPYSCHQCSFSFKTKGNLTKHLKSKAHTRKTTGEEGTAMWEGSSNLGSQSDSEDDRLEIDSNAGSEVETETGLSDFDEEEDLSSDDDSEFGSDPGGEELKIWHKKFLPHRTVHTPPPQVSNYSSVSWSLIQDRDCISAPPDIGEEEEEEEESLNNSSILSPNIKPSPDSMTERVEKKASILTGLNLPVTVANLENSTESSLQTLGEISPFLKSMDDRPKCQLCKKEFRKIGDLRLHMNVHAYNESNKRYQYNCPVCNSTLRSKALLAKHIAMAHPNCPKSELPPSASDSENSPIKQRQNSESMAELGTVGGKADSGGGDSLSLDLKPITEQNLKPSLGTGGQRFANNPRPFECTDCGTAFRIHGHLAKHLRCKIHVMKLECQGKLPIGTYAKIEELGVNLNEVDTADCERSLKSLQKIADRIIPEEEGAPSKTPAVLPTVKTEVTSPTPKVATAVATIPVMAPKVSLACTEEMRPSPPPHLVLSGIKPDVETTAPAIGVEEIPVSMDSEGAADRKSPTSIVISTTASLCSTGASKSVVANVWCPPTQAEIAENHLTVPTLGGLRQKSDESTKSSFASSDRQDSEMSDRSSLDQAGSFETGKSVDLSTDSAGGSAKSLSIEQQSARCKFCETDYQTEADLNVHLHADHILMRDGNDFKCPRANCDLVFPNKESLRHHIATHFFGGGGPVSVGSPAEQTDRDGNVSCETMAALRGKLAGGTAPNAQALPAGTGGNTSPGTPEESQTSFAAAGRSVPKKMKTHLVKLNSIPESTGLAAVNGVAHNGGSQEFKSPSMDNSPMSDHSDGASRGSSSHSASPVLHHQPIIGGPATFGRPLIKRKSVEELGSPLAPPSHLGTATKLMVSPDPGVRRCSSAVDHSRTLTPTFGHSMNTMANSAAKRHPASSGNYLSLPSVPTQLKLESPGSGPGLGQGLGGQGLGVGASGVQSLAWLAQGLSAQQALLYGQNQINGFAAPKLGQFLSPFFSPGLNGSLPGGPMMGVQGGQSARPPDRASPGMSPAGGSGALNCTLCQKECPNALALQEHLLAHIQVERPHICQHCDAGFTNQQALQAHLRSHQEKAS